jgi:hypothetical protein
MPRKQTVQKARKAAREGKAPSTQAGEFVHEEIEHVREGKHGARSAKQAIAIGLSKARRAGVRLPAPKKGEAPARVRRAAKRALAKGKKGATRTNPRRSRAMLTRLRREGRAAASKSALSRQARSSARKRSARDRSLAARKAARTKGPAARSAAARKAARTRARRGT